MFQKLYDWFFGSRTDELTKQKNLLVEGYSAIEKIKQLNREIHTDSGNIRKIIQTLEYIIKRDYEKGTENPVRLRDLAVARENLKNNDALIKKNEQKIKAYEQQIEQYRKKTNDLQRDIKNSKLKSKLASWKKNALNNQSDLENASLEEKATAVLKENEVVVAEFETPDEQQTLNNEVEKIRREFNGQKTAQDNETQSPENS